MTPRCPDCGGPMEVLLSGGEEPDPERPGKWRPSTKRGWRCVAAFEAYRARRFELECALTAEFRDHLEAVWIACGDEGSYSEPRLFEVAP